MDEDSASPDALRAEAARLLAEADQRGKPIRRSDLPGMTWQEINRARRAGRLNHLLAAKPTTKETTK